MTRASALLIFLLAVITVTIGASNNRAQSQSTAQRASGQVSGHIYRADTGAPIGGAIVALQSWNGETVALRSSSDGSYTFSDVNAGGHVVIAYRSGFVGPVEYGNKSPMIEFANQASFCPAEGPVQPFCLSVAQGQKVGGIDVRLTPNPDVATLPTDPIAATYPSHKVSFDEVRFSPDGQILAINTADELWLYDMRSHRSVPAILPGHLFVDAAEQGVKPNISANTPYVVVSDVNASGLGVLYSLPLWWVSDDTLYAEVGDLRVLATMAGAKEVEDIPPKSTSASQAPRYEHGFLTPTETPCTFLVGRNDRFLVTLEGPPTTGNCGTGQLIMARAGGTGAEKIAGNVSSADDALLFDAESSLILYSDPGGFFTGVIGSIDLKTGQTRTLALPYDFGLRLLDRSKDGTLAYRVAGPCVADDSVEQALVEWIERGTLGSITSEGRAVLYSSASHVCFVKFP